MRYFYDTEFIEDGKTIDLVSIGVVAEDGREYYAVSTEFNESKAGPWVRANVLNQLPNPSSPLWKNRDTIREELLAFFTEPGQPRAVGLGRRLRPHCVGAALGRYDQAAAVHAALYP